MLSAGRAAVKFNDPSRSRTTSCPISNSALASFQRLLLLRKDVVFVPSGAMRISRIIVGGTLLLLLLLIIILQINQCECFLSFPLVSLTVQQNVTNRFKNRWMKRMTSAGRRTHHHQLMSKSKQRFLYNYAYVKYYNKTKKSSWSWCSTSTVTTTSTSIVRTQIFCATVIGVRGACRRRKKLFDDNNRALLDNKQMIQSTKRLA